MVATLEKLCISVAEQNGNVVVQTVDILVNQHVYRIRFIDVSVLNPMDEAHLRKRASPTET